MTQDGIYYQKRKRLENLKLYRQERIKNLNKIYWTVNKKELFSFVRKGNNYSILSDQKKKKKIYPITEYIYLFTDNNWMCIRRQWIKSKAITSV